MLSLLCNIFKDISLSQKEDIVRKIFKIFSFFALCLFIFCGCAKSNSDINSTLSDTDVINLLDVYHEGRILQRNCNAKQLDVNDFVRFYYYTKCSEFSNPNDYYVSIDTCKNYLSSFFDISDIDFSNSIYYEKDKDALDLNGCTESDGLTTKFTFKSFDITDKSLTIFYDLEFLLGDDSQPQSKVITLIYDSPKQAYIFDNICNS